MSCNISNAVIDQKSQFNTVSDFRGGTDKGQFCVYYRMYYSFTTIQLRNKLWHIELLIPLSEGRYVCNLYENNFRIKEDLNKNIAEDHEMENGDNHDNVLNDEDDYDLELAAEDPEIYDSLDILTKSVTEPEKVDQLQEKLKRFKIIMIKKTVLQKKTVEELKSARHAANLSAQVEAMQSKQLDEKDKEQGKLVKELKVANSEIKGKEKMIDQLKEALGVKKLMKQQKLQKLLI